MPIFTRPLLLLRKNQKLGNLKSRQTWSFGRTGTHNTLKENIKPAYDGRKRVINFWVFDKSNEEGLLSNTNSAWISQKLSKFNCLNGMVGC